MTEALKIDNLDKIIESLNITYKADFVPQSKSRNKGEKHKSINWIITLGNGVLVTDYMQGVGHIPKASYYHKEQLPYDKAAHGRLAAEEGKYTTDKGLVSGTRCGIKPIPAPLLKDVLYSLVMEADVLECGSFEAWAAACGYDADSRKAYDIYKTCLENALKLKNIIGYKNIDILREAFQDY